MTRQLLVIRHAKTGDGHPDIERSLTARGRADAAELGRILAARGIRPARAVVSPAVRAQQTWTAVQAELPAAAELATDERIYDNHPALLLDIVRETADEVDVLALVGHNPSFGALIRELSGEPGHDLPTGAVAIFDASASWSDLDAEHATLTALIVARADG